MLVDSDNLPRQVLVKRSSLRQRDSDRMQVRRHLARQNPQGDCLDQRIRAIQDSELPILGLDRLLAPTLLLEGCLVPVNQINRVRSVHKTIPRPEDCLVNRSKINLRLEDCSVVHRLRLAPIISSSSNNYNNRLPLHLHLARINLHSVRLDQMALVRVIPVRTRSDNLRTLGRAPLEDLGRISNSSSSNHNLRQQAVCLVAVAILVSNCVDFKRCKLIVSLGATNTQNTGSSLFAQNNQQQQNQPAAGGLFGNTAAKPGGLFGSTTTGTNTTGTFGGFGQINSTQPATGGLFGGANTNTAGTGSSLFGQPQQPPATGGLFGNSGGSSLFGAKPAGGTTGSLFGSTQPAQQPAQGGTSSLFGNTGQTGGLFGSSTNTLGGQNQQQNQAKSAGSLFGGGGLFGSQQQQQTQQNQGTTGGMFGNLGQSQPASASLFGSQPQQPAQQPALGGSLFGSGFGQSTNTQPQLAQPSLTTSIDQNPYGRNDLFNYTGQKLDLGSSAKKPALPPLTSSTFRATPSKSQLHKLRGFASPLSSSQSPARAVSPLNVLASPGPSTFANSPSATDRYKGLTDTALSPNAFVPRPSIKKLTVTPKSGQINGEDRLESVLGKSALKSSNGTPASVPERAAPVSPATLLFNPPAANGIPSRPADEFHSPLRLPQRLDSPLRASGSERPPKKGDYWCKPKLEKLKQLSSAELRSMRNFTAGRKGYGEVTFLDPVDLTDLDLPAFLGNVVVFTDMELAVYPDDYKDKPPQGKGLNVPARISLENCFPKDKATKQPITDINDPRHAKFLKRVKNIPSTDFVSYTDDGTWTFTVEHFSKYGIADSDEESEEEMHSPEDVLLEVDEESLREVTSDEDFLPPTKGLHDDEDEDQEGDDSVEEEDEEMDDEGSSMTETEASSYEGDQTIHAPPELAWDAPAKMKIGEEGMRKLREMQSSFFSVPKRAPARFGMTDKADEKQAVMKVKRMLQSDVADFVLAGGDDVMLDGRAVKVGHDSSVRC